MAQKAARTVLLAWELGSGLGHVSGLRLIAHEMAAQGWRPVFVLRDVVRPRAILADDDFSVLQAPVWSRPLRPSERPYGASSYADILTVHGFTAAEDLRAVVEAWQSIIDTIQPSLIVADHSPTLCLTAYGDAPVVLVGNGFSMPPIDLPEFPALRPEVPPLAPQSRILETIRTVQKNRGRPAPETLPALLAAPVRSVCSFPELDPYNRVRSEPVLGPLEALPGLAPMPEHPSVFAYLSSEHPAIEHIVAALADLDVPVSVYFRGMGGAFARFLAARGIAVHDKPPPLAEAVRDASAVLSHANMITAHAALTAGRPQVLLPLHLEMELTARALEAIGVGPVLRKPTTQDQVAEALRQVVHEAQYRGRAAFWAEKIAQRGTGEALRITVDAAGALVA